jgi:hypothetical protein
MGNINSMNDQDKFIHYCRFNNLLMAECLIKNADVNCFVKFAFDRNIKIPLLLDLCIFIYGNNIEIYY